MDYLFYIIFASLLIVLSIIIGCVFSKKSLVAEADNKIKQDITAEKMKFLEGEISDFLRKNNLAPSASLDKVVSVLKVVEGGEDNIGTQANLSEPDVNGYRRVIYRLGLNKYEKKFALAHECGHLINGDGSPASRLNGNGKPESEQVADYIAAALLLPKQDMEIFLNEHNYFNATRQKKIALVKNLRKKYDVEEIIVIRRINEIYAMN